MQDYVFWYTFGAQILNFLILVYLLKRFLYRPILDAMAGRQQRLSELQSRAETLSQDAKNEAERYRRLTEELENLREDHLAKIQDDVAEHRKTWLEAARSEVDQSRDDWYAAVKREQHLFLNEIGKRAAEQVKLATSHVIEDLAGAALETQIVERFLGHLKELDKDRRQEIVDGLRDAGQGVTVTTAFELAPLLRTSIEQALEDLVGKMKVQFQLDPRLICGIEFRGASHKVAWSVEEYLSTLNESLTEALEDHVRTRAART